MHVGHLRSSVIGDSLQRLFRANGWNVTSDIHLGDWGLQMGQLISEIGLRGIAPVYFEEDFKGPYPKQSPVTMSDLEELYPAASAACKADPARMELARQATAELQAGRPAIVLYGSTSTTCLMSGWSASSGVSVFISTCGRARRASIP